MIHNNRIIRINWFIICIKNPILKKFFLYQLNNSKFFNCVAFDTIEIYKCFLTGNNFSVDMYWDNIYIIFNNNLAFK